MIRSGLFYTKFESTSDFLHPNFQFIFNSQNIHSKSINEVKTLQNPSPQPSKVSFLSSSSVSCNVDLITIKYPQHSKNSSLHFFHTINHQVISHKHSQSKRVQVTYFLLMLTIHTIFVFCVCIYICWLYSNNSEKNHEMPFK